jgi:hypothetical protein
MFYINPVDFRARGHGVLAPGCIFEYVKKNQTKMLCVHLHVLGAHEVALRKKTFYVAYVKITKLGAKNKPFLDMFCCLHSPQKICFPAKESICTWDQKCISVC